MPESADTRQTYLSSYRQFGNSDAGRRHPWLRPLREDAIARFEHWGFPTTRDEGWRHTNVAPIAKVPFKRAVHEFDGLTASELGSFTFGEDDSCRLVFINGQYSKNSPAHAHSRRNACAESRGRTRDRARADRAASGAARLLSRQPVRRPQYGISR